MHEACLEASAGFPQGGAVPAHWCIKLVLIFWWAGQCLEVIMGLRSLYTTCLVMSEVVFLLN